MTENMEVRRNSDLEKRSKNGTYVYSAIWLVIGIGTNFSQQAPTLFYSILFAFVSFGFIRYTTYANSSALRKFSPELWTFIIFFNALMPTLLLSLLLSAALLVPLFEPLFLFLLLSVFGVLSGGIVNFSPRPRVSFAYLLATIVPPFISLSLLSTSRYMEATLLLLYGTYMFLLSRGLNKEYTVLTYQQIELEKLNKQDGLTGIANRRSFDQTLRENWALQSRQQGKISLMLIDIDHFKQINDNLGHLAGDHAIQSVANVVKSMCRRVSDIVARIGGEEFAVLVSATDHEPVTHLAEKLRQAIADTKIEFEGNLIEVTISIGVASFESAGAVDANKLFNAADKRLYKAKEMGRNIVVSNDEGI